MHPPQPIKEMVEKTIRSALSKGADLMNSSEVERARRAKEFGERVEAFFCSDPAQEAKLLQDVRNGAVQQAWEAPNTASKILTDAVTFIKGAHAECTAYRAAHGVPSILDPGKAAPNSQQPKQQQQH